MEKNNTHTTTTALTIFFVATAVVMIGGLAVVPTATIQSASASHGGFHGQVTICHLPPSGDPTDAVTITVGGDSVAAHVREHGDYIGACQPVRP
jgi:hypothetical protein